MEIEINNIYNVNCYDAIKEIPDKSIDLIVTDPPYDIQGIHGAGIMASRDKGNFSREIKENGLDKGMDYAILDEFVRVLKKINVYIWCNKSMILPLLKYFVEEKKCNYEIIIWAKENPIPFCGTHYLVDKEYCLYFWEQGAKIDIPFERARTVYLTKNNIEDKKNFNHPTIKNIEIIENLILNSSEAGGVVLDPFLGSGTTAVAAKRLNRNYIGFEINPKYYQIAKDRLNDVSQIDRKNIDEGQLKLF
ncbi:MAG: site-specific DNA-methyltransferase [Bacilli bacterium]|nr:site-specific DNA-methyltransferase [Bacilli bacterium]